MKITITQKNLNNALNIVSRVAASRSATLPILSNILIKADKGNITLSTTNLEIAITHHVAGKIEETGSITVPARLMSEFISSLPDEPIQLALEDHILHIQSGNYKSQINGIPSEDFPSLPSIKKENPFSISSQKIKEAISQVNFAASSDESRQVLTGVYFYNDGNNLYIAATDSYRLAEKKISGVNTDVDLIIPSAAMAELNRIINDEDDDIKIFYDDTQVLFEYGDVQLISRLIDGRYPDYKQLIPKDGEIKFTVKRSDFINITKVSALFARESAGSITLHVSEDKQEVYIKSIASQVGENTSEASAEVTGDGEITLNSRYLLDALNAFNSESIKVYFSGKINPCVIQSSDSKQNDYQHIVMPLRS